MKAPLLALACVDDTCGFRALEREWRALHASCPHATPFNSWEWLFSWWQAYGEGKQLRLLTWRMDGTLAGVAPLYAAAEKSVLGTSAAVLRMVGDGSGDSDYLEFPMIPALMPTMLAQLASWLADERGWDALAMRDLPEASSLAQGLSEVAAQQGLALHVSHGRSGAVELPRTFGEFLGQRQPRFRTKLRALLKRLDQGALVLETQAAADTLRARLRSLYTLHQARWTAAGGAGVFGELRRRRFYAHFAPRFARRGWLRLYSLKQGEAYRAHQLCFASSGVTYLLQEGFDVSSPAESYGQMLRAAVMRDLIANGERRYDFLGGFSGHKEIWGAREGRTVHLLMARSGWRARLYTNAPVWRERLAGAAHRFLPERAVSILKRARTVIS